MRKAVLPLILLSVIILSSCKKEPIIYFPDDPSLNTIYGTWKLVSRENYATNDVFYKDPNDVNGYCTNANPCDVIFTLSKNGSDNVLAGHTITNQVSGAFTFDPLIRQLTVTSFGGTKVGEPHWSDYVWKNIQDVGSYKVNNQYLRLFLNSKQESMTFQRQ